MGFNVHVPFCTLLYICDVIKQNESELTNVDLDTAIQFPLYFIVLSITKMAISLEPHA